MSTLQSVISISGSQLCVTQNKTERAKKLKRKQNIFKSEIKSNLKSGGKRPVETATKFEYA